MRSSGHLVILVKVSKSFLHCKNGHYNNIIIIVKLIRNLKFILTQMTLTPLTPCLKKES